MKTFLICAAMIASFNAFAGTGDTGSATASVVKCTNGDGPMVSGFTIQSNANKEKVIYLSIPGQSAPQGPFALTASTASQSYVLPQGLYNPGETSVVSIDTRRSAKAITATIITLPSKSDEASSQTTEVYSEHFDCAIEK